MTIIPLRQVMKNALRAQRPCATRPRATSHDNDDEINDASAGFIMTPCEDDRSQITTKIHNLSLEKLQGRQEFVGQHKRHYHNSNHQYHRHRRHSRSSPAQPQHTRKVQQQPSRFVERKDSRTSWSSLVWVMEESDMTRSPSSSSHANRSSSLMVVNRSPHRETAEKSQRIVSVILDQDVELAPNNINSSERSNASTTTSPLASATTRSTVSTLSSSVAMVENDDDGQDDDDDDPANYYCNCGSSSSVAAQNDKEEDSSTALMEEGQPQQFIILGEGDGDKAATTCQSSCCTSFYSRSFSRWLFLLGCLLTLWIAIDGLVWARKGQSVAQEDSADDHSSDDRKLLTGFQVVREEESNVQSKSLLSPITRRNLNTDNSNGNRADDLSTADKSDSWWPPIDKNQSKQQWSVSWETVDNNGHVPMLDLGAYVPDTGLLDGAGRQGINESSNSSTDTTTTAPTETSSYIFEPQEREEPYLILESADEQSDDLMVLNAEIVPATSSLPSQAAPTLPPKTSSPTRTTVPKTPSRSPLIPPVSFTALEEHLNQTTGDNDVVDDGMGVDSIFRMQQSSTKLIKKMTLYLAASLCFTLVGVFEWLHKQGRCCFSFELWRVSAGLLGVWSAMILERHAYASDILHVLSVHCFFAYATTLLWLRYHHPSEGWQLQRRSDTKSREDALLLADLLFTIGAAMAVVATYLIVCQDQAEMIVGIQRAKVFAAILWTACGLVHICCHLKSR